MFIIRIIFILITFIILFLIAFYYLQRYELLLRLKKTRTQGYSLLSAIKSPEDTRAVLMPEFNLINDCITEINSKITSPPPNKELELVIPYFKTWLKNLEEQVIDKKGKWERYLQFKEQYNINRMLLRQNINKLREKETLLLEEHKENVQCINEKIEPIINSLKSLISEYDALKQTTFIDFNFSILDEVEKETEEHIDKVNLTLTELQHFNDEVKVFINSINRRSTFYITLESENEENRSRERIGEITVSYKTYKESSEGKKYKKDTYIGNKRVASISEISFTIIFNGKEISKNTKELNNQEFEDLFSQLPIDKQIYKEVDEKCCPYEIYLNDVEILAWEKPENSFEINAPVNIFNDFSLNDILELKQLTEKVSGIDTAG